MLNSEKLKYIKEIKISTSPYVIFCQKYCVAHELKIIFITQVRIHTTIYTFKIYVLPWFESQSQHYIFAKCIKEKRLISSRYIGSLY